MLNAQSLLKNQKLTFLPACAAWAADEAEEAPEPSAATAAAADEAVAGYPEEAAAAGAAEEAPAAVAAAACGEAATAGLRRHWCGRTRPRRGRRGGTARPSRDGAHNHWGGLISYFNADRGGQAYAYKPELP